LHSSPDIGQDLLHPSQLCLPPKLSVEGTASAPQNPTHPTQLSKAFAFQHFSWHQDSQRAKEARPALLQLPSWGAGRVEHGLSTDLDGLCLLSGP